MPLRRLPPSSLFVALMAASAAVSAAPPGGRHSPPSFPQASRPQMQRPQQAPRPSRQHADDALSDSVRRIERRTRGQVLSAEQVPYDGRSVNRIKVIDERGRVRVYMDDPQSQKPPRPEPPTRGDDD